MILNKNKKDNNNNNSSSIIIRNNSGSNSRNSASNSNDNYSRNNNSNRNSSRNSNSNSSRNSSSNSSNSSSNKRHYKYDDDPKNTRAEKNTTTTRLIKNSIVMMAACMITIGGSSTAFAMNISDIVNVLSHIYGVNLDMKNINQDELQQLRDLSRGLTGTHQYGAQYNDPNAFSWGGSTDRWQDLLSLSNGGMANGPLSSRMERLSRPFPIRDTLHSPNDRENEYYRLQAQTTLASRASSEVAFEQVNQEASVIHQLQSEIDRTPDTKSALDLNNRLLAEQNKLSIQETKLLVLLVQQTSVDSQGKANRAVEDAEFFNYHKGKP